MCRTLLTKPASTSNSIPHPNCLIKLRAQPHVLTIRTLTHSIQNILSLVEDGNGNVQKLKGLNKENQQAINKLIDTAQDSMNKLNSAAQEAVASANAPPNIPPSQFTGRKGTACLPGGVVARGSRVQPDAGS